MHRVKGQADPILEEACDNIKWLLKDYSDDLAIEALKQVLLSKLNLKKSLDGNETPMDVLLIASRESLDAEEEEEYLLNRRTM